MLKRYGSCCLLTAVCAGLVAAPPTAFAGSGWWHLSSSARPSYLRAGQAANEKQTLTVSATGGSFVLIAPEGKGAAFLPFNVSRQTMQEKLEGLFGSGTVEVPTGEGDETGAHPYEIVFTGALTDRPVEPVRAVSFLQGGRKEASLVETRRGRPDGYVVVTATDLGDANVNGEAATVNLHDGLPAGLAAIGIEGVAGNRTLGPVSCIRASLTCTFGGVLPAFKAIEMRIAVLVQGASAGELNRVTVTGGEAQEATLARPIVVSDTATPFGVEDYKLVNEEEGGTTDRQAGSHPFQQTTTLALNETLDKGGHPASAELPKDLSIRWPPGLIGNPSAVPQCSLGQFLRFSGINPVNECPEQTAVGVAVVTIEEPAGQVGTKDAFTFTAPVFNLEPAHGEPARFGFIAPGSPVIIDAALRSGDDYGVTIHIRNITQTAALLSSTVTIWGVPGDPRHDSSRGYGCLGLEGVCSPLSAHDPPAFLQLPTQCSGNQLETTVTGDSWERPGEPTPAIGESLPALNGCNRLPFNPSLVITPERVEASRPTGLSVDLHVPQQGSKAAAGLVESAARSISVALPEGLSLNPAGSSGLEACSEDLVGFTGFGEITGARTATFTGALPQHGEPAEPLQPGVNFCSDASKIGTVTIRTPILPNAIKGGVYLASQNTNPFGSLLAMYVVAEDPVSGVLIKLVGDVHLGDSGQIVTTFENSPQAPFEDAEFDFFGGERASLTTPSRCGVYTAVGQIVPWASDQSVVSTAAFKIASGPNGRDCPGATLPFSPVLTAGTTSGRAGAFSTLVTNVERNDGDQELRMAELQMPPGLEGLLSTVKLCPETQANAGTCGPESEIGEATVSAGTGNEPVTVPGGRVYITEKYDGAPFGLSIASPARTGPFDLEHDTANPANQPACDCVVARARIEVNPFTGALTITTDASGPHSIPRMIDGVPIDIRAVSVVINRPHFVFNPTNCNVLGAFGTIAGFEGAVSSTVVRFQATDCASLAFAPRMSVTTSGRTTKVRGASLNVKVSYPPAPFGAQANVAKVKVDLPKQLPSRLTTLQQACRAATFDADPANCPPASIVGRARVITPVLPVPLTGPAYFVSHGGQAFPSLTMVLQGYGVTVDLVGATAIKHGITSTTFGAVPDVPFASFELSLPQGRYSALAANADLCHARLTMPATFHAQNGAELHMLTKIGVTGCGKRKPVRRKRQRRTNNRHK